MALRHILFAKLIGQEKLPTKIYLALEHHSGTESSRWFPGVPLKPLADIQLIKYCLRDCENTHRDCNATKHKAGQPKKVIDVRSGRVVSTARDCRYLALSYVWGPKKPPNKLTDVVGDDGHDATASHLGHVSPAITDAIVSTQNLGENYLWVDALCIDQKDSTEKAEEIKIMNVIYERAVATIVLLQRSSSDHVLGVASNLRSSQDTATLHGHIFRRLPPNFMDSVRISPRASRA